MLLVSIHIKFYFCKKCENGNCIFTLFHVSKLHIMDLTNMLLYLLPQQSIFKPLSSVGLLLLPFLNTVYIKENKTTMTMVPHLTKVIEMFSNVSSKCTIIPVLTNLLNPPRPTV